MFDVERIAEPLITVPFFGTPVVVKVRELTETQILACGNFSLIETLQDKINKKNLQADIRKVIEYAELQHEICRRALVSPTYDQIVNKLAGWHVRDELQNKANEIEKLLQNAPLGKQKTELERELAGIRAYIDLLLPADFCAAVVSYALGLNKSDVKNVTEEMLLDAARLAELGHDNPADHLQGIFTPFMRDDINKRAWALLAESRQKKQEVKLGG